MICYSTCRFGDKNFLACLTYNRLASAGFHVVTETTGHISCYSANSSWGATADPGVDGINVDLHAGHLPCDLVLGSGARACERRVLGAAGVVLQRQPLQLHSSYSTCCRCPLRP